MNIVRATSGYERWLSEQIDVVTDDLDRKHELMDENAFSFFRATHYRWLQRALDIVPALGGPRIPCVGDLHLENFGTWRNASDQQVWGINDLDASEELPYTLDLARLATSASLAIADADAEFDIDAGDAHKAILRGYSETLSGGGEPFVLADGRHERLAELVDDALPKAGKWWRKLGELPKAGDAPPGALEALGAVAPAGWDYELHIRTAGAGSRGHPRFVAIGELDGEPAARELKQLAPPPGRWLDNPASTSVVDVDTVRSPDPLRAVRAGWLARRIAPDCVKLDLAELDARQHERRLLEWMGRETANLHLGSPDRLDAIRADLESRDDDWLADAADALARATRDDWKEWRERGH